MGAFDSTQLRCRPRTVDASGLVSLHLDSLKLEVHAAGFVMNLAKRLHPLQGVPDNALQIHEIFASIQGESTYAGRPCTFIRTTACNLRCTYCDTRHAFYQGRAITISDILRQVHDYGLPLVELTGGEPLLQANALVLMKELCDAGLTVLLETSGSVDIGPVDRRVHKIVDFKTPASGEVAHNLWNNVQHLQSHDEVKFVLADAADYAWAKEAIAAHQLTQRCTVLMSAVFDKLQLADLASWLVRDRSDARMQIQMHKVIWEPHLRGV